MNKKIEELVNEIKYNKSLFEYGEILLFKDAKKLEEDIVKSILDVADYDALNLAITDSNISFRSTLGPEMVVSSWLGLINIDFRYKNDGLLIRVLLSRKNEYELQVHYKDEDGNVNRLSLNPPLIKTVELDNNQVNLSRAELKSYVRIASIVFDNIDTYTKLLEVNVLEKLENVLEKQNSFFKNL